MSIVATVSHLSYTAQLLYKLSPENGSPYPFGPLSVCPVLSVTLACCWMD